MPVACPDGQAAFLEEIEMYAHIIAYIEFRLSKCSPLDFQLRYLLETKHFQYAVLPTLK